MGIETCACALSRRAPQSGSRSSALAIRPAGEPLRRLAMVRVFSHWFPSNTCSRWCSTWFCSFVRGSWALPGSAARAARRSWRATYALLFVLAMMA